MWLVATGAEERPYTGRPDHLGASALAERLKRDGRINDVRSRSRSTRSAADRSSTCTRPPKRPEPTSSSGSSTPGNGSVRWVRDPKGEGNSDHRELARAGAPAAKLGVVDEPCRHTACDTPDRLERGAFTRVLKIVWPLLRDWS